LSDSAKEFEDSILAKQLQQFTDDAEDTLSVFADQTHEVNITTPSFLYAKKILIHLFHYIHII